MGRRAMRRRSQYCFQHEAARVLIVDDEVLMRDYLDKVLRSAGYLTVRAVDGQDAAEIAESLGPFDLLLTDEMMPRMEGHELAQLLRRREPHMKVLYLTGYAERLFNAKGGLWEDEAFLDKPSSPTGILEAVSLLLNGRIASGGQASAAQTA